MYIGNPVLFQKRKETKEKKEKDKEKRNKENLILNIYFQISSGTVPHI